MFNIFMSEKFKLMCLSLGSKFYEMEDNDLGYYVQYYVLLTNIFFLKNIYVTHEGI